MLASPTRSATSRAGQPRPGATGWAVGWAQLGSARGLNSPGPDGHCHGGAVSPGAEALGEQSAAPRSGWVEGSQFLRSGRRGGAHGCPLQMQGALFTPSSCPAGARVGPAAAASAVLGLAERPPPHRGCRRGLGRSGRDSPPEFGVPHPTWPRGSVRCRCQNHFRAAQPVPPAPAGGSGGGAARTGTGKEVTFKPCARGDREEGWGDGGERSAPGRPRRALGSGREPVKRRSSNKNID